MDAMNRDFFRWADSGVSIDVGFPDAREDTLRDPKRVYWAKLTVRESAQQNEVIDAVIEETLMHWRTAAECVYRGDKQSPHEFYTKRTHTLQTPINAPLIVVAGDVRLATGESVYVTLTERGTAAQAISDAHHALAAKQAVYKRLEAKLGADVIAAIPAVPPKPWANAPQSPVTSAPVTAPAPAPVATTPTSAAIYIGGKKAPKDYPYVDGQVYIFDIHAVTAKAELDETGNPVYTWNLWGKYGDRYGNFPDFVIDGSRDDSAAVMEGLWRLGLNRVISTHQPVTLRYTAKCRIADSKKEPGKKTYYFNPVYIEAAAAPAAPPAPAVASY